LSVASPAGSIQLHDFDEHELGGRQLDGHVCDAANHHQFYRLQR